jgi:hypothetical protein
VPDWAGKWRAIEVRVGNPTDQRERLNSCTRNHCPPPATRLRSSFT